MRFLREANDESRRPHPASAGLARAGLPTSSGRGEAAQGAGRRRRWLVAADPFGAPSASVESSPVEDELVAVALFADLTLDLSASEGGPAELDVEAYAILRSVELIVDDSTLVVLGGGVLRGELRNEVPEPSAERCRRTVRVHGHSLFGDVTARLAPPHRS